MLLFLLPFFIRMQDKVFFLLNLNARQGFFLKLWGLKFAHEVLNQTTPKWIALNWTIQSQIKACTAKLSCEISAFLRYYTAMSGNSLTTFQDNLSVPTSRVKKWRGTPPQQQHDLIDTVFFFGNCSSTNFLNKHGISRASSVSVFKQRSAYHSGPLRLSYS
jgi:hypothetical protein